MTWATVLLALAAAGFAAWAAVLATESGKLRAEIGDADQARQRAEHQLHETAREFAEHRKRADKQLEALREDILQLEDDLDSCTAPGARRRRIERLLSKAARREDGGRAPELRG